MFFLPLFGILVCLDVNSRLKKGKSRICALEKLEVLDHMKTPASQYVGNILFYSAAKYNGREGRTYSLE